MIADERIPNWAEVIWERDLALTSDSLEIAEWPLPEPVAAVLGDLGLALRITGAEDPVRVLADLQAAARLPRHTRLLAEVPGASEDEILRVTQWLELHGFRVFLLDVEGVTWRAVDRRHLGDLAASRSHQPMAMGSGSPPPMDAGNSAALYAVRGADVLANSVVSHSAGLGGAELSLLEWCADLFAQGHMIHCYVPPPGGPLVDLLQQAGVACSFHATGWWITTADARPWTESAVGIESLITDLDHQNPDLVITQTSVVPGGALAAAVLGIPHVWWVHERPDPEYGLFAPTASWTELGEVMRRLSRRLIANSRFVADCYWPGMDDIEIVYPVRLPLEIREPVVARPVAEEAGADAIPTIGVLGSLTHAKGPQLVLAALADLRDQGIPVRARFAGMGVAERVEELRLLAEQLGVADLVDGIGTWSPLPDALDGLLAVVVPSWAEGFGRVPVEAICHRVPVIYSRSGALLESLEDGVTGLAFEPGNAADLANAIAALASDAPLRVRLAGSASALQARLEAHNAKTRLPVILGEARSEGGKDDQPWPDWAIGEMVVNAASSVIRVRESLTAERDELLVDLDIARADSAAKAQLLGETQTRLRECEASLDAVLTSRTWRAKARLCRMLKPLGLCKG